MWVKYSNSPAWINAILGIVVPILTITIQNNNVARVFWCLFMALNIDRIWEQLLLSMFGRAKPWRWHDCFYVCSTGLPTSLPLCRYQHSHRVGSKLRGNHVFPIKTAGVPGNWSGFQWPQHTFFCHLPHCTLRRAPRQRSTSKPMLSNKPMYSQTETVQPCGQALGNFRMGGFNSKDCNVLSANGVFW